MEGGWKSSTGRYSLTEAAIFDEAIHWHEVYEAMMTGVGRKVHF